MRVMMDVRVVLIMGTVKNVRDMRDTRDMRDMRIIMWVIRVTGSIEIVSNRRLIN